MVEHDGKVTHPSDAWFQLLHVVSRHCRHVNVAAGVQKESRCRENAWRKLDRRVVQRDKVQEFADSGKDIHIVPVGDNPGVSSQ